MFRRILVALVIIGLLALPLIADAPQNFLNGAVTTAVTVKNTAGTIYGFSLGNTNASACYLQIFNATAGNVTLGTTVPIIVIANNATTTNTAMFGPVGPAVFTTAISVAATTAPTGGTPCATGLVVDLLFL